MSDEREEHYRRILRECHPLITQYCNPDQLVGPLSAQHLLTSSQSYTLENQLLAPLQRLNDLVEWLPRKGDNWFERFANALADTQNTDGHVIVLKKMWEMAAEANWPLPSHLQTWSSPEPQTFGNYGDSLFANNGDSLLDKGIDHSYGNLGNSLSMDTVTTVDPVEEQNTPMQEQYCPNDMPSLIILDKVSLLLVKALGQDWALIHNYCYQHDGQFTVAISNIKKEFHDHPHMQTLMTLKQWTRAQNCSCQHFFDRIRPLLDQSPLQSQLRTLLSSVYRHDTSQVTVTRPTDILEREEIASIAKNMFGQISSKELYRIAFYYEISDDTMETLKNQYGYSPVALLSNILLQWISNNQQVTRYDLAVILDNLGISPNSVM